MVLGESFEILTEYKGKQGFFIKSFLYDEIDSNFIEDKMNKYPIYTLTCDNDEYRVLFVIVKGSVISIFSDFQGWIMITHKDELSRSIKHQIREFHILSLKKYNKYKDEFE